MRFLIFLTFLFTFPFAIFAGSPKESLKQQIDSVQTNTKADTLIANNEELIRKAFVRDSLTYKYLKPDPNRPNPFTDSLLKEIIVTDPYLLKPAKSIKIRKNNYGLGQVINRSPLWFFLSIIALTTFFAIIKIVFKKQIDLIFRAFYDPRVLNQINKEDHIFVSWQFLFLYLLFSLTVGLFICLILYKVKSFSGATDFYFFLLVSLLVFLFFGFKILILRFLGFLFKVQRLVKDYTNIIYLTYFNSLFFLLPLTIGLGLINFNEHYTLFWVITSILTVIIGFQLARIMVNILINYRLSKFYLILYLCVLEICPILILARTINSSL